MSTTVAFALKSFSRKRSCNSHRLCKAQRPDQGTPDPLSVISQALHFQRCRADQLEDLRILRDQGWGLDHRAAHRSDRVRLLDTAVAEPHTGLRQLQRLHAVNARPVDKLRGIAAPRPLPDEDGAQAEGVHANVCAVRERRNGRRINHMHQYELLECGLPPMSYRKFGAISAGMLFYTRMPC